MSRNYKNIIKLKRNIVGKERRENLVKEVLQDNTPLPKPLEYEDIDKEFERWVSEDLDISFEEQKLPTYLMLSNQRFSEYLQSWQNVDDKKNLILNFKAITRENNPKLGSIVGDTRNIPGNIDFLMKRVHAVDKSGHRYFIDYRVKQPISIDFIYTVSIFTNKYQLLNEFNMMMNEKFKAIDCYIRPNGHFIPMKLTDISDESEYNIDDRRYYSQSYLITVMAYIMPKDSFRVVEQPMLVLECFDGETKPKTIIESIECDNENNPYEYEPIDVITTIPRDKNGHSFRMDCDSEITSIILKNTRYFRLLINGKEYSWVDSNGNNQTLDYYLQNIESSCYDDVDIILDIPIKISMNDLIKIDSVSRYKAFEDSVIKFKGKDFTSVIEKE